MVAGLSWLIVAYYSTPEKPIAEVLAYITAGIWAVIVAMLALSGMDIGEAILTKRSHEFVNTWPWILGAAIAATVGLFVWHYRGLKDEKVIAYWVRFTALSSLGAAIFCGLSTGIVSALDAKWWSNPPAVAVYIVLIFSILVPAVPLIASIPPAMAARIAAMEGNGSSDDDKETTA